VQLEEGRAHAPGGLTVKNLEILKGSIPEAAKDVRLNVSAVLEASSLTADQRWGVAVAAALASRNAWLTEAVVADAREAVPAEVIDDAIGAASLMAMNNVYYRFRHFAGKESYSEKPARLRMQRLARPATSKETFELLCLAVSAINGCETCVKSHERVVVDGGLTEDQVHDAVRIAAVVHAAAVALEASELTVKPVEAAAAVA
jgi:alkyl hydroperoxide reductase subunit D